MIDEDKTACQKMCDSDSSDSSDCGRELQRKETKKQFEETQKNTDRIRDIPTLIENELKELIGADCNDAKNIKVIATPSKSNYTGLLKLPKDTFQFHLNVSPAKDSFRRMNLPILVTGNDYPYTFWTKVPWPSCCQSSDDSFDECFSDSDDEDSDKNCGKIIINNIKEWKNCIYALLPFFPFDVRSRLILRIGEKCKKLEDEIERFKSLPGGYYEQLAQQSFEGKIYQKNDNLLAIQTNFLESSSELKDFVQKLQDGQRKFHRYENIFVKLEPTLILFKDEPDIRFKVVLYQDSDFGMIELLAEKVLLFSSPITPNFSFILRFASGKEMTFENEEDYFRSLIDAPTPELWKVILERLK